MKIRKCKIVCVITLNPNLKVAEVYTHIFKWICFTEDNCIIELEGKLN